MMMQCNINFFEWQKMKTFIALSVCKNRQKDNCNKINFTLVGKIVASKKALFAG